MGAQTDQAGVLCDEFSRILSIEWHVSTDLHEKAQAFLEAVGNSSIRCEADRRRLLIETIKTKFRLNRTRVQNFVNRAAGYGRYFDPVTRTLVQNHFDRGCKVTFCNWLKSKALPETLQNCFNPVSDAEALSYFSSQLNNATINRSDARVGVQDERRESILRSHFGSWIFSIAERPEALAFHAEALDRCVNNDDYLGYLHRLYPGALDRSCGLYVVSVSKSRITESELPRLRRELFAEVEAAYGCLSNHSYLCILFNMPDNRIHSGIGWELIHDVTLYGERFQQEKLTAGFYRPKLIEEVTKEHIHTLDLDAAVFSEYQHGFGFRDCIIVCHEMVSKAFPRSDVDAVILLMEKNVADERAIPCPACWSLNVRGNSYPVFGVKSWECQNPLCPERSAFNRGNRFSLAGILRERAANDPAALIPEEHLKSWKLDVVGGRNAANIYEMLIRHYSLPNDQVTFVNCPDMPTSYLGRTVRLKEFEIRDSGSSGADPIAGFERSSFFSRYLKVPSVVSKRAWHTMDCDIPWLRLYEGDCLSVLQDMPESSVDGAVTSPPYYNAREYASWPNIYCYLYDMKIAAEGVFRVLKSGSYYLFNIFDYFDNDKILAMSALGKRRLCLGAYLTQIFRHVGFTIVGNIVWHKGEIEGKRNYNQGNRAPYVQLPLNTWEHILILRKPGQSSQEPVFPGVIYCQPVMKWFNGENRHGHTAPFPEEIPQLLCAQLPQGATILDPFSGSLTTTLACQTNRQQCVSIELYEEYCRLGLRRVEQRDRQRSLFL